MLKTFFRLARNWVERSGILSLSFFMAGIVKDDKDDKDVKDVKDVKVSLNFRSLLYHETAIKYFQISQIHPQ